MHAVDFINLAISIDDCLTCWKIRYYQMGYCNLLSPGILPCLSIPSSPAFAGLQPDSLTVCKIKTPYNETKIDHVFRQYGPGITA